MRLVVTGGGTGGHVFPALEVARRARAAGWEVAYFGSFRGQEKAACSKEGIAFFGFPSEPVYSLKSLRGLKAILKLAQSAIQAKGKLRAWNPDAIFSTGGYSSAPIVRAAGSIPYVLHEQNSRPGRSNLIAAKNAYAVATTFRSAENAFPGAKVVRTGLPVRAELRELATAHRLMDPDPKTILVVGGSQGAASLNEAALACATRMTQPLQWVHVTGRKHFEAIFPTYEKLGLTGRYQLKSYLEGKDMAAAYANASVVVGRSGAGTLSELAAFGLPSVLVPYPHAHANHQFWNAREFEELGAAVLIEQDSLDPMTLESALTSWIENPSAHESARAALTAWDEPEAGSKILALLEEAVR